MSHYIRWSVHPCGQGPGTLHAALHEAEHNSTPSCAVQGTCGRELKEELESRALRLSGGEETTEAGRKALSSHCTHQQRGRIRPEACLRPCAGGPKLCLVSPKHIHRGCIFRVQSGNSEDLLVVAGVVVLGVFEPALHCWVKQTLARHCRAFPGGDRLSPLPR